MISRTLIFLMMVALLASTFCTSYGYPAQASADDDLSFDDLFSDFDDADDDMFDLDSFDLDPSDRGLIDMLADVINDNLS
uniref:Anionic-Uro-1 n=1 Tax=Urodacus manicatus TaxID=1330407 RepID=T1DEK2_UROMN